MPRRLLVVVTTDVQNATLREHVRATLATTLRYWWLLPHRTSPGSIG